MRIFNLLMFFVLLRSISFAQSETMPVILVSANTKVTYQNNSKIDVIPGSIMNKTGTLWINPNGRVVVYHNYMFVEVTADKSPVDLNKLFVDDELLLTKSEQAFGNKMSEAVYTASKSGVKMKNQNALISGWGNNVFGDKTGSGKDGWGDKTGSGKDGWGDKTGSGKDGWGDKTGSGKDGWGDKTGSGKDGWGDKTGSGKDGWGKNDIMTRSASPGGKYTEGLNKVSWEPLKGTKKYTFVIEDMNHKLVFSTEVKGTEYSFDSNACKLTIGTQYAWYVHHPTKKQVSTPVFFTIIDKEAEGKAVAKIKSSEIYQKSNASVKLLMEAHQAEEEGFLLSAQTKYQMAIQIEPNNSLAKMMYSLFCKNMNEIKSAVEALK